MSVEAFIYGGFALAVVLVVAGALGARFLSKDQQAPERGDMPEAPPEAVRDAQRPARRGLEAMDTADLVAYTTFMGGNEEYEAELRRRGYEKEEFEGGGQHWFLKE